MKLYAILLLLLMLPSLAHADNITNSTFVNCSLSVETLSNSTFINSNMYNYDPNSIVLANIVVVFLIGFLLIVLGQYLRNSYIMSFSSIWFAIISISNFFVSGSILGINNNFLTLFFIGLAGILAVHSWFFYEETKTKQKRSRFGI